MQTKSKNPIGGCSPGAIGRLRFAGRAHGNELAGPGSNVERDWRKHTTDRPVNGEDCTVWKWTRAPPVSAGSCDLKQS